MLPWVTVVFFLSMNCSQILTGAVTEKCAIRFIDYKLGYLKDSNAAAHSVDTGIECPIYMLESTRIFTISL